MTDPLHNLRALLSEASPLPWEAQCRRGQWGVKTPNHEGLKGRENAELSALAINSLPALLDLVAKADQWLVAQDERDLEDGLVWQADKEAYRLARAALGKTEGGTDG